MQCPKCKAPIKPDQHGYAKCSKCNQLWYLITITINVGQIINNAPGRVVQPVVDTKLIKEVKDG